MSAVIAKPYVAFIDCQQCLPAMPRRACCAAEHMLSFCMSLSCKNRMAVGYILWIGCGSGLSYLFIFVLWTTEISLQHPTRNQCHCPGAIGGSYQKLEQDWARILVDPLHAAIFSQVRGDSCLCFTMPNKAMNWISASIRPIKGYLDRTIEAGLNI